MTRKERPPGLPQPDAVTLVEITDIEATSEDESVDGIHPTDEGMRRHARRLEQAVRPMLTD
jgi:lysophospholipase L1-like esterase